MLSTVLTKSFPPPPINFGEILRYMNAGQDFSVKEMEEYIKECENNLSYNVCYCEFPLTEKNGVFDFSFMKVKSTMLKNNLSGCSSVIIFAATAGIFIDRLIAKYGKTSPSKALFFQAFGTERVESLADAFSEEAENELKKRGLFAKKRISPGYGDFPLSFQSDILNVLDASKRAGISLSESLIMSPSKSVTAIIGVSSLKKCAEESKCSLCTKTDCLYRDDLNER